ncbi:hypothetical protein BRC68_04260 [Halobacteriales archaeon QH_6_64_20]|nr:MAG: hypothetical protein BRC68_04260 [Halobacteriales archaeon QH_6_64_20]
MSTATLTLAYEPTNLQAGTITDPANGTTAVAIQGFHFEGEDDPKKPARLVAVGPQGSVEWTYNGSARGASWFYDVDPLPNGNLLAVNTARGKTFVYELDPETKERVWTETLPITDTHDVDLINENELLIGNLRNSSGDTSDERIYIYNRTTDRVTWEWEFEEHYPPDTDVGVSNTDDWSHVNDVDEIAPGKFLVSPRNFDQVIVVDRETKEITMRLGADGNHTILDEQHNPTYLESENGTPTILVADSENDRVVEYARLDGSWERIWTVGTDQLNWPRDADRLPNGNTLIVDTLNQRVIEVTPRGEIVWEQFAPWAPYDAERLAYGDEAGGPTIRDLGVSGSYELSGGAEARAGPAVDTSFPTWLTLTFGDTPIEEPIVRFAERWEGVSQWIKPVWMAPWGFVSLVGAGLLGLLWGLGELFYGRRRLQRGFSRVVGGSSER